MSAGCGKLARRANQCRFTEILSSPSGKNIPLFRMRNQWHNSHRSRPVRDVSRSSRHVGRECGGRSLCQSGFIPCGRNISCGRRSRVVLAPRPWRYVGAKYRAGNGGKKGRFPGESTKETVKTIARGRSEEHTSELQSLRHLV